MNFPEKAKKKRKQDGNEYKSCSHLKHLKQLKNMKKKKEYGKREWEEEGVYIGEETREDKQQMSSKDLVTTMHAYAL